MQSSEELSLSGYKAHMCSLPTTHCDPFTPATKPRHVIHVQIQFHAEVQLQIHGAAQLKQN